MLSNPDQTWRGLALEDATLAKRLDLAADLALHGPEQVGRELCAAIFLQHAQLLANDEPAKRCFLECLLLLRMESLLQPFLRACYGFEPTRSVLTTDGTDRTTLGFPSGASLVIAWAERGEHATQRRRFAACWSDRVLAELAPTSPSVTGGTAEWEAVAAC